MKKKIIITFLMLLFFSGVTYAADWCQDSNTKLAHLYNEASGNTVDCGSNGNDGVVTNALQNQTGQNDKAVYFDGVGDVITVADDDTLDGYSAFSVGAWVRADNTQPDSGYGTVIIKKSSGAAPSYVLWIKNVGMRLRVNTTADNNTSNSWETNGDVSDDSWHHVVWTWSSGSVPKAYVDGVQQSLSNSAGTISGTMENSTDDLYIGANGSGTFEFKGYLDDVFVMGYELDLASIQNIYNNGFYQVGGGDPSPPVLSYIGTKSGETQSQLAFQVSAADLDGGTLTFDIESPTFPDPPITQFFTDNGNGTADFDWTPALGEDGSFWVNITVTDDTDRTDDEDFLMTIISTAGEIEAEARAPVYLESAAKARVYDLEQKLANMSVRPDHPRLYINQEDIAGLQAKSGQTYYNRVITSANKPGITYDGLNSGENVELLDTALAYLLTGNTSYVTDVYDHIMNFSYGEWTNPVRFSMGMNQISDSCMAFDWVYNGLSPSQRDDIVNLLGPLSYIDEWYQLWVVDGNVVRGETQHREEWIAYSKRFWCPAALSKHYAGAEEVFKKAYSSQFYWGDAARMYTYFNDGVPFEGYYIGPDGCSYFQLLASTTGIDDPLTWCEDSSDYWFYKIDVDNLRTIFMHGAIHNSATAYGLDWSGSDPPENLNNSFSRHSGGLAKAMTYDIDNPYKKYILNQVCKDADGPVKGVMDEHDALLTDALTNVVDLIWDNDNYTETNPNSIGWYHRFFPGGNELFVGTGMGGDDTRVDFRAFPCWTKTSHGYFNSGAWGIYKNGHYLTNSSGIYDAYDGQVHLRRYAGVTWAHNNTIIYDLDYPESTHYSYLSKISGYADPGGLVADDGQGNFAWTRSFQSVYSSTWNSFVHNPFSHWQDITGPQSLAEPEITDEYVYAVGDLTDAYGYRVNDFKMHFMTVKEPTDSNNMWVKIYKPIDAAANTKIVELIHMPTEPSCSGTNPTICTWKDYYNADAGREYAGHVEDEGTVGQITLYIMGDASANVIKRSGSRVGQIEDADVYTAVQRATAVADCKALYGDGTPEAIACIAALPIANTYPIENRPRAMSDIRSQSGAHYHESALQWRLEIEPSNETIDLLMYVHDSNEAVPGTQPNITWSSEFSRLVLDGTIPTPDPEPSNPVLASIGNKSLDEGDTLAFQISATDADGDDPALEIFWGTLDSGNGSFVDNGDGTADFVYTSTETDAGVYNSVFTARDNTDRTDSEPVQFTIYDITTPIPPVWIDFSDFNTYTEEAISGFTVEATDADTATLNLTMITYPTGATFQDNSDNTGTVSWTPTAAQGSAGGTQHTFTFRADDGSTQRDMDVVVTVLTRDQYPVINPIIDRTVTENELLTFPITVDDDGDTFSWSLPVFPEGAFLGGSTTSTETFFWTPTGVAIGDHDVTVRVVDSADQEDTESFTITVEEAPTQNRAPVIDSIDVIYATEEDVVSFILSYSDPDNDPLEVYHTTLPEDAEYNESTQEFTWQTNLSDAGNYTIIFTVIDDKNASDSEIVQIVIADNGDPTPAVTAGDKITFYGTIYIRNEP
jgi:hypothetical protein